MRVFGADVDVTLGRAHRDAGDGHAFDQHEWIAFHDHAVGKGAAVALIGVADDVFLRALGLRHRAPLDAGRESGAAAAAQTRLHDFLNGRIGSQREYPFEAAVAAMGAIVFKRARINHAAAGESEPGLALEPGNVLSQALSQRMRPVAQDGAQQTFNVARRDRSVGDAARGRLDFDQRLEPVQPARAVVHDFDRDVVPRGGCPHCGRDFVGADCQRPGIDRYVKPKRHCCASANRASSRVWSSLATTRPFSIADGASAQSPRQ